MTVTPQRYVVVGAGGVGIPLCNMLTRQLEYEAPGSAIIIIDGDNFEEKNKTRQQFSKMGNKAKSIASDLVPQFPETDIIGLAAWIIEDADEAAKYDPESEEDPNGGEVAGKIAAIDLLEDGDVVFAVVDNFSARKILFDAASKLDNVDVFSGGNGDSSAEDKSEGYFATMIHYQRRDGKDVTVNPADPDGRFQEFANPADRNPGELSCQERAELEGGTQTMATNNLVASLVAIRSHAVVFNGQDASPSLIYCQADMGVASGETLRPPSNTNQTVGV